MHVKALRKLFSLLVLSWGEGSPMPSPASFCPRGKGAALGQRDQKFSRAGPRSNPEESQASVFSDVEKWK